MSIPLRSAAVSLFLLIGVRSPRVPITAHLSASGGGANAVTIFTFFSIVAEAAARFWRESVSRLRRFYGWVLPRLLLLYYIFQLPAIPVYINGGAVLAGAALFAAGLANTIGLYRGHAIS